ncbi:LOW QUALITY PROTEIN: TIR domain-containing protein-like [Eutrema salsugineum]|uniref:LOW QUALITY PROTEIN: TIR domain-containing protein-like n=1 Tax=Eutrema salsugineum TaxID=72664 RepID=UPI000CED6A96|nr:LOW QUALITY PROTEIN: TIR domain-containing protein-like [Eutrema salsugineum]
MAMKTKVHHPQVFINFRGAELRDNFVNRLVMALREGEINVFLDVHELKGRKLRYLLTRIKMSKITLAVFSKYGDSKWCLDELAEMKEHMKEGTLVVIPIFYNVTASDVKRAGNLYIEKQISMERIRRNLHHSFQANEAELRK